MDVDGDGILDFNDSDGDGCADLNIKWPRKDGAGNIMVDEAGKQAWVVINGDRDGDGVPDLNIDVDGDGKPDLNIDSDEDGNPDVNLVILTKKDWQTPTICSINTPEKYCTGTKVKALINVDIDGTNVGHEPDGIPDINIDTNGDFKPDFNITKENETVPYLNIGKVHEIWRPVNEYKIDSFVFDTDSTGKPLINIDTTGNGRADVNVDLDGDGKPDINLDIDGDWIPDVDIDTTGDGKPDVNIDYNKDGIPDEEIMDVTDWKPEQSIDGEISYDTMKIERMPYLEDQGIIMEKQSGAFLPNYALRVHDITESQKDLISENAISMIEENQEIKQVYQVVLLRDGKEIQDSLSIRIKIPVREDIMNPVLLVKQDFGKYENASMNQIKDHLIYEGTQIKELIVIGDIVNEQIDKPKADAEDDNAQGNTTKKNQDTQKNHIGGVMSGDTNNSRLLLTLAGLSFIIMFGIIFKQAYSHLHHG